MGENVLKGQLKGFKKGWDRVKRSTNQPTLFSRPETMSVSYTAAPTNGFEVRTGDQVYAHPVTGDKSVCLAKGHVLVGQIDGEGAQSLIDFMKSDGDGGILLMTVTDVTQLSGYFKVQIAGGNDQT